MEVLQEIRPGRNIALDVYPSGAAKDKYEYMFFFYHGSMAHKGQWKALIDLLNTPPSTQETNQGKGKTKRPERNFACVSYDAFGCGASDKPNDADAYLCSELLADALAVYSKYANSTGKNVVMGHSFGTSIVAKLHAALSQSPSPSCAPPCANVLLGTSLEQEGPKGLFSLPLCFLEMIRQKLSDGFLERAFSPATPHEERLRMTETKNKNLMYVCQFFYSNFEWATRLEWETISSPTLIIQGDDDAITAPAHARALFDDVLSKSHPGSSYVGIPDGGHQVMMEKPKLCEKALRDWLETTCGIGLIC